MSHHVLMIDNYDSFTYNLVQALMTLGAEVTVRTNDSLTIGEATELEPTHLVISPGPGRPEDAGVSMAMIEAFSIDVPVLGDGITANMPLPAGEESVRLKSTDQTGFLAMFSFTWNF